MGHQETYRHNEAYAKFLASWDAAFYAKYADTLKPDQTGARALDVGCGVGQVVARLKDAGFDAHGVDVSEPNIERARQFLDNFERLPLTILVPDRDLIWKAAEIKAEFSISYADCFAVATAMGLDAKVVTGDPDFKKTIQLVAVEWV